LKPDPSRRRDDKAAESSNRLHALSLGDVWADGERLVRKGDALRAWGIGTASGETPGLFVLCAQAPGLNRRVIGKLAPTLRTRTAAYTLHKRRRIKL